MADWNDYINRIEKEEENKQWLERSLGMNWWMCLILVAIGIIMCFLSYYWKVWDVFQPNIINDFTTMTMGFMAFVLKWIITPMSALLSVTAFPLFIKAVFDKEHHHMI